MRLERLVIENFRQFKGRQEIIFSDLSERNVTLVHAENGFGKTTLLKALLWGLYGRNGLMGNDGSPDDFEKPDSIIHEGLAFGAQDPDAVAASVEITFKHHSIRYILTRRLTLSQQNISSKQADLSLEEMKDGQTYKVERPQSRIESIIPEGISRFLFFNGERINYLAMEKNRAQVTEAIQQMLGLKLLQTTIEDLKHQNVRGKFRSEQKSAVTEEKRIFIERLNNKETEIEDFQSQKQQILKNLDAISKEIDLVNTKLAKNRKAKELQTKRIKLIQEKDHLVSRRKEVEKKLMKIISDDGFTFFSVELLSKGKDIVNKLRTEGKIPARVLNSFLNELLDSEKCICQRSLPKDSPERKAVEKLMTIAGDQDFNNAVGSLDHALGHIEAISLQASNNLNELQKERLQMIYDIRERDEEIEKIHQVLGAKKDEEVQNLEATRKSLSFQNDSKQKELGSLETEITKAIGEAESLKVQIRQIEDKEEAAALAQRRVNAVEDCIKILADILEAETQNIRPLLNDEINKLFRKIMTKDYWTELTNDYTLKIRKKIAGELSDINGQEIDAALSTGERTVTSLVFIASLVALGKKRSEIPTILKGLSGSVYPVAIDSPFGSLSIFRPGVARYIPELAPQVLLLVSPEQYNGAVESALTDTDRVGKRYYLVYHGPTMPDQASPELVVHGEKIQQYFPSQTEEYTEIKELKV